MTGNNSLSGGEPPFRLAMPYAAVKLLRSQERRKPVAGPDRGAGRVDVLVGPRVRSWSGIPLHVIGVVRASGVIFSLATLLCACQSAPAYLPSHPTWEMFPRASSPPANFPGQYRTTVENSNGTFFVGFWGTRADGLSYELNSNSSALQ